MNDDEENAELSTDTEDNVEVPEKQLPKKVDDKTQKESSTEKSQQSCKDILIERTCGLPVENSEETDVCMPLENLRLTNTDESYKNRDETRSVRSVTTTSTIPPDVIKKRVQMSLKKRQQQQMRHKNQLVKGEASAVTRSRRDNIQTIRDSTTGFWAD